MQRPERARHIGIDAMRSMQRSEWQIAANKIYSTQGENMIIPALPEAVHIRRSAHGFTHSFSHLQMDAYGRECAQLALDAAASACESQADQLTYPSTGYVIALVCAGKIRSLKP